MKYQGTHAPCYQDTRARWESVRFFLIACEQFITLSMTAHFHGRKYCQKQVESSWLDVHVDEGCALPQRRRGEETGGGRETQVKNRCDRMNWKMWKRAKRGNANEWVGEPGRRRWDRKTLFCSNHNDLLGRRVGVVKVEAYGEINCKSTQNSTC